MYNWDKEPEDKELKATRRANLTTVVSKFCVQNSINMEVLTPYHFRLTRLGFTPVDVFPTSSKIHILKARSKHKVVDLYTWLKDYYK